MTDYNAMLVELLNEKISRLELEKNAQCREINRLKKELSELKKTHENAVFCTEKKGGEAD